MIKRRIGFCEQIQRSGACQFCHVIADYCKRNEERRSHEDRRTNTDRRKAGPTLDELLLGRRSADPTIDELLLERRSIDRQIREDLWT